MYQLHYVRPGETVESVAKQYGMTKQELTHINQLRENHTLVLGHRLHVHKRRFNEREPEVTQDPPPSTRYLNSSNQHKFHITDFEDFPGPKTNDIPRTTHTVIKRKGLGKLLLPVIAVGGCIAALRPKIALASAARGSSGWGNGKIENGKFVPCYPPESGSGYGGGARADTQYAGNAQGGVGANTNPGGGPNPTYVHTSTGSANTQGSGSAQGNASQAGGGPFSSSASIPGAAIGGAAAGLIGGATLVRAIRKSSQRQDAATAQGFRKQRKASASADSTSQGNASGYANGSNSGHSAASADGTSQGNASGSANGSNSGHSSASADGTSQGSASGSANGSNSGHASASANGTGQGNASGFGNGSKPGHASASVNGGGQGNASGFASGSGSGHFSSSASIPGSAIGGAAAAGVIGGTLAGKKITGVTSGTATASGSLSGNGSSSAGGGKYSTGLTGDASGFASGVIGQATAPIVSRNEFLKISAPLIGAALTGGAIGMFGAGAAIINATHKKGANGAAIMANNTGGCGMSTCFLWPLGGDDRLSKPDPRVKGGILILNTRRERFVRSAAAGTISKILTPHNTGNKGLYTIVIDHSYGSCRSSFKSVYSGLVRVDEAIKVGMSVTHDFIIGEASNCCDSTLSFCILDKDMPVKDTTRYLPSAGYESVKRTQRPVAKLPRC